MKFRLDTVDRAKYPDLYRNMERRNRSAAFWERLWLAVLVIIAAVVGWLTMQIGDLAVIVAQIGGKV